MEGKIQPGQEKATSKEGRNQKPAPLSLTRAISERNLCSSARDKVRISFVTSNQPPVTSSNSKRNNETLIARFKGHIAAVACILCFFLSLEMPQLFLTLYVYDHTTGKKTGSRPITEVKPCRARLVLRWVTTWEPLVL